ncbi:hypothetical protein [Peribacillus simplex]
MEKMTKLSLGKLFQVLTEGNMISLSMFYEGDSFEGKEGINAIEAAAT